MSNEGLTVLSLFDGMSCGAIALREAGIKVKQYFASEIDKVAIRQTQHNFPETIQLGSVVGINVSELPHIDLLIGGSPCQGFSFAGKQLNFNDPRSVLFFAFTAITLPSLLISFPAITLTRSPFLIFIVAIDVPPIILPEPEKQSS